MHVTNATICYMSLDVSVTKLSGLQWNLYQATPGFPSELYQKIKPEISSYMTLIFQTLLTLLKKTIRGGVQSPPWFSSRGGKRGRIFFFKLAIQQIDKYQVVPSFWVDFSIYITYEIILV